MGVKFSNNGHSTLAASITSSDTSITVASGHGARFPSLGAGDYFYATLIDASNNLEIVKCTARSSDVLTVVRGQESTTARAYAIADRIELRVTAQGITDATDIDTALPSQTSNSGKYLTTDGTNSSWGTVNQYSLPSQTGNSGKVLTTDGTNESWGDGEATASSVTTFKHTTTFVPTDQSWTTMTAWTRETGAGHFVATGGQVSESGGVFTFAETGTYLIYGSVMNYGGNSIRRFIVNGQSTKDGGSNWTEIGRAVISRYDTGGTVYTCPTWIGTMNVTNTSTDKFTIRVYVERATGSDTVGVWDDHLPWTFMKLSEAY